jgi:hypothetical protein
MFIPMKAGDARKDRAEHRKPTAEMDRGGDDDDGDDHADHGDGHVLPAQIGLSAFLDRGSDLLHLFIAGRCAEHLAAGDEAVDNGQ